MWNSTVWGGVLCGSGSIFSSDHRLLILIIYSIWFRVTNNHVHIFLAYTTVVILIIKCRVDMIYNLRVLMRRWLISFVCTLKHSLYYSIQMATPRNPVFSTVKECSIWFNVTMMHCDQLTQRARIRDGHGDKMSPEWKWEILVIQQRCRQCCTLSNLKIHSPTHRYLSP